MSKRTELMRHQTALQKGARRISLHRVDSAQAVTPASVSGDGNRISPREDWVAVEEPLEIRIAGEVFSTTMRTPGADRELALGQLLSEGVITKPEDISTLGPCASPGEAPTGNVIAVDLAPGVTLEEHGFRRGLTNSACGVCGRQHIDDLLAKIQPLTSSATITTAQAQALVERLGQAQAGFQRTGGTHAAAAMDVTGQIAAQFEDIGRHNAVDKVLGQLLRTGALPAHNRCLVVSSRASFEIIYKACLGGFPIVICVSAASSLAIETAHAANITLLGFVRSDGLNVYTDPGRFLA